MAKPKEHFVAGFVASQWTGQPALGAGNLFLGTGVLTFLVCLLLMIFIEPLRNFGVLAGVCTLVAIVVTAADIISKVRAEKSFLLGLTARVNGSILEMTGDPNAQISARKLQQLLLDNRRTVPLQINGVPGLELKVVTGDESDATRILALRTTPDYGLKSFDLLLNAERQQ